METRLFRRLYFLYFSTQDMRKKIVQRMREGGRFVHKILTPLVWVLSNHMTGILLITAIDQTNKHFAFPLVNSLPLAWGVGNVFTLVCILLAFSMTQLKKLIQCILVGIAKAVYLPVYFGGGPFKKITTFL